STLKSPSYTKSVSWQHYRQIPGFGNVVNIVNKLANEGLVIIEDSGHKSMPHYHVTEKGYNFVKSENK
ncbi:hypothetical protein UQ79_16415, partial [Shigella dysenteriae]